MQKMKNFSAGTSRMKLALMRNKLTRKPAHQSTALDSDSDFCSSVFTRMKVRCVLQGDDQNKNIQVIEINLSKKEEKGRE